jgi:molybdenum cofactor biosynthesis enzyme MoaA
LRSDLAEIITGIRELGIDDLSMITNGSTLPKTIEKLYEAGLPRLNISLYTLDSLKFENTQCVRRSLLDQAIAGVDAALKLGYVDTKINYVIESRDCMPDLLSILTFAGQRNLTVVTLPMLKSANQGKNVISLAELDELIRSLGVVAEKSLIDEVGIQRSLLTLKSGARILLRRHELGDLGPFLACKSCHYSPECQEGIFPLRLSETGVLSPLPSKPHPTQKCSRSNSFP